MLSDDPTLLRDGTDDLVTLRIVMRSDHPTLPPGATDDLTTPRQMLRIFFEGSNAEGLGGLQFFRSQSGRKQAAPTRPTQPRS